MKTSSFQRRNAALFNLRAASITMPDVPMSDAMPSGPAMHSTLVGSPIRPESASAASTAAQRRRYRARRQLSEPKKRSRSRNAVGMVRSTVLLNHACCTTSAVDSKVFCRDTHSSPALQAVVQGTASIVSCKIEGLQTMPSRLGRMGLASLSQAVC